VTIAATCTDAEGYTITFTGSDNAALTITYDDPSPTWTTTPGASWKAVNGSTNTLTARLTDQYGRVLANKAVTSVVTGRNPATTTHTTSAAGYVTWTGTDSSTSTVVLTDSIQFNYPYTSSAGTAATASSTARVITYAATAVAVGSITLTDDEADNSVPIDQK